MKKEILKEEYTNHQLTVHTETPNVGQMPCSPFANLNLNVSEHQRHPSGELNLSPVNSRSPLPIASTPTNPPRLASFLYTVGQPPMHVDPNSSRLQAAPIQVQQHQHQTQLYQPIPLQPTHHQMHDPLTPYAGHSGVNGSYDGTFTASNNGITAAAKCLTFNYSEPMPPQNDQISIYQPSPYAQRVSNKKADPSTQSANNLK